MAMEKNKVKFGLNKVHYAKITSYDEEGVPTFAKPVRIPGAVSLSIDAEGEASNFYADDGVYYVINNNSGYTGDLEIALVPLEFATDILGEKLDEKGVLTETNTAEVSQKTDAEVYENWYKAVYMPNLAAAVQSGKASAASVKA